LTLIHFDVTLLPLAATTADELAIVLAQANGEKGIDHQVKITRDRAYTYMQQAADEIKNCGRYVPVFLPWLVTANPSLTDIGLKKDV
ncbi:MAG TPA: hypothetical protein VEP89_12035, partial [Draconibacterium sp.]|nr:hypothetical protein [Draconibacterium sp.]